MSAIPKSAAPVTVQRYNAALAEYKRILSDPTWYDGDGWSPPPNEEWKDKHWSRELRRMWPDYRAVKVVDVRFFAEKRQWCREQQCHYWVNGSQNLWYFDTHQMAVLFKLSFGGDFEL